MGSQQFPINLSGVLVAALLILAAILNQPRLTSERPPAAKIGAEPSGPFQDVPARIWEDPLEAVARARPSERASPLRIELRLRPEGTAGNATSTDGPWIIAANRQAEATDSGPAGPTIIALYLRHLVQPDRANRLLLLPVMVSGAPHAALREQRLRIAAHAGLNQSGFVPLRGDRLGNWTWRVGPSIAGKPARPGGHPVRGLQEGRRGAGRHPHPALGPAPLAQ